jgi:hypothetical protein
MITINDLPNTPENGVYLLCPKCAAEYSACKGDYFMSLSEDPLKCNHGNSKLKGTNLRLVRKVTMWVNEI